MVILRPTRRLRTLLPPATTVPRRSDTALGDWYVNRIVVDHHTLLLLVSASSLRPMLLPARNVRELPQRLPDLVEARLRRCAIPGRSIEVETKAMASVTIGPTVNRSVLGIPVDFAKAVPCHLERGRWDDTTLQSIEAWLAETPCCAGRRDDEVIFPDKKAPELLRAKWGAG